MSPLLKQARKNKEPRKKFTGGGRGDYRLKKHGGCETGRSDKGEKTVGGRDSLFRFSIMQGDESPRDE